MVPALPPVLGAIGVARHDGSLAVAIVERRATPGGSVRVSVRSSPPGASPARVLRPFAGWAQRERPVLVAAPGRVAVLDRACSALGLDPVGGRPHLVVPALAGGDRQPEATPLGQTAQAEALAVYSAALAAARAGGWLTNAGHAAEEGRVEACLEARADRLDPWADGHLARWRLGPAAVADVGVR